VSDPLVHCDIAAGVATVTLDSPHNRNALSSRLIDELLAALDAAVADEAVRVVVLTHTGPVFCSGADLKETAAGLAEGRVPAGRMGEVLAAIWECPKPVVARIGGPARAGGLGIVAAADIAVCATDATFAFSEVRLGVVPAVISATVLPRLSPRAAAELFLTGERFDGSRAVTVGLVTAAVPADELDAAVGAYVAALVRGGPVALSATKALLRGELPPGEPRPSIRDQLTALTEASVGFFTSTEGREGVLSFVEKRDPAWIPAP
jgi:methylglutaconyl-CoA hydratase